MKLDWLKNRVLILVLMENALVLQKVLSQVDKAKVLILVLMENALVPIVETSSRLSVEGLNPCFNGKCTRTSYRLRLQGRRS